MEDLGRTNEIDRESLSMRLGRGEEREECQSFDLRLLCLEIAFAPSLLSNNRIARRAYVV